MADMARQVKRENPSDEMMTKTGFYKWLAARDELAKSYTDDVGDYLSSEFGFVRGQDWIDPPALTTLKHVWMSAPALIAMED